LFTYPAIVAAVNLMFIGRKLNYVGLFDFEVKFWLC
jgi:hypothetical protein